jgi:hypothetical protein
MYTQRRDKIVCSMRCIVVLHYVALLLMLFLIDSVGNNECPLLSEMLPILHKLQSEEGLAIGGSAGINVAGAMRVAEALGPGHTVVTVCTTQQPHASSCSSSSSS